MSIDWMKYRLIYGIISIVFLSIGVISLFFWGLELGLEFTGGVEYQYQLEEDIREEVIVQLQERFPESVIQTSGSDRIIIKLPTITDDEKALLQASIIEKDDSAIEVQSQLVGPSIGPDLIKKTGIAILIVIGAIFAWVAVQFRRLPFGVAAVFAMLHDAMILVGVFSILGNFYGAQVDFLFVTAVLTTLSFSVHDTIVVFDRIRELSHNHGGDVQSLANRAVSETMRRSIINSLTIIVVLIALVVLGGESIRWFAAALLAGAVAGTYSSPFVAVPLYVSIIEWRSKGEAQE